MERKDCKYHLGGKIRSPQLGRRGKKLEGAGRGNEGSETRARESPLIKSEDLN